MHKIINKIFALSLLTVAATFTAHNASAQYWVDLIANQQGFGVDSGLKPRPGEATFNPSYKTTLGHQYGFSPSYRNWLLPSHADSIVDTAPTVSNSVVNEALGCNFDTHQAVLTNLNVDSGEFVDYLSSPLGTFMISALYTSPATAAAYDSLYAFGSSRAQVLQDRCNAAQVVDDSVARARWDALQECITRNSLTGPPGSAQASPGTMEYARAYKLCLLSPEYFPLDANETTALNLDLTESQEAVLASPKYASTLFEALQESSLCYPGVDRDPAPNTASTGNDCALMTFLPNFRWCTVTDMDNKVCSGGDIRRLTSAVISPKQIYNFAFALSEPYVQYGLEFARRLMRQPGIGVKGALSLAHRGEFSERQPTYQGGSTYSDIINASLLSESLVSEAADYMGCSPNFARMRFDGTLVPSGGALPIAQAGQAEVNGYVIDFGDIASDQLANYYHLDMFFDANIAALGINNTAIESGVEFVRDRFWNFEGGALATGLGVDLSSAVVNNQPLSTFNNRAIYNPYMALKLILQTLSCTMLYEQRLSLADFVELNGNKEHAQPLLYAVRSRWAYLTADKILRFLKYKLRLAEVGYAYDNSTAANSAGPHITKTLNLLVDMVDNDIRSLERTQESKNGFSTMMSRFIEQTAE